MGRELRLAGNKSKAGQSDNWGGREGERERERDRKTGRKTGRERERGEEKVIAESCAAWQSRETDMPLPQLKRLTGTLETQDIKIQAPPKLL